MAPPSPAGAWRTDLATNFSERFGRKGGARILLLRLQLRPAGPLRRSNAGPAGRTDFARRLLCFYFRYRGSFSLRPSGDGGRPEFCTAGCAQLALLRGGSCRGRRGADAGGGWCRRTHRGPRLTEHTGDFLDLGLNGRPFLEQRFTKGEKLFNIRVHCPDDAHCGGVIQVVFAVFLFGHPMPYFGWVPSNHSLDRLPKWLVWAHRRARLLAGLGVSLGPMIDGRSNPPYFPAAKWMGQVM